MRTKLLLAALGSAAVVIPDLVSGIVGDAKTNELSPSWIGGISGLNIAVTIGAALVIIGLLAALASYLPLLKSGDDIAADPWGGQTLEWLAPSPPPLANFVDDLPVVTSAEPLTDLREEK